MEVEAVRGLSWEGGRGDMAGEAMEVEAVRRPSWGGGRGDMAVSYTHLTLPTIYSV